MMLQLQDLPVEILCTIAGKLDAEKDINALARTSRHLYNTTNDFLYRHNAIYGQMSALVWAARHEISKAAQYSLDASFKVPNKIDIIYRALSVSVRNRHTSVARILLSQEGIDVNIHYREIKPRDILSKASPVRAC